MQSCIVFAVESGISHQKPDKHVRGSRIGRIRFWTVLSQGDLARDAPRLVYREHIGDVSIGFLWVAKRSRVVVPLC